MWNKAKSALPEDKKKDFYKASILKFIDFNSGKEPLVCYNENIWKEKGWCDVKGSAQRYRNWGICSSSCDFRFQVFC